MEAGEGGAVTLVCREPKEWEARKGATRTSSEHPGSAVVWEGDLWEVLSVESRDGRVRYLLAPWDDRHVVRVRHAYDDATESARARESARLADAAQLRLVILAAAPLTGLLPGEVQRRWEVELGVPAARLTIVSAVIPFVVGTGSLLFVLAGAFGGEPPPPILLPLSWFMPESMLRFGLAMSRGTPVGSVLGYLFWYVWRGIAAKRGGR